MGKKILSFYKRISNLKWPKTYTGKILLIAFFGTHIPLLTLIAYLTSAYPGEFMLPVLFVALLATLLGTALTLVLLYKLLEPIRVTKHALVEYRRNKVIPKLPIDYRDDVGKLMSSTQLCIEQLDDLLKLKNRLISMVSHDSKTPISSIKLASELIIDELDAPDLNKENVDKYLEIINVNAKNFLEFMDNMLSLAKFDDGKLDIEKTPIAFGELAEKVQENHEMYFKMKEISLEVINELPNNDMLLVDRSKIMPVLNNLVQNAIKFTKTGDKITLKAERVDNTHLIHVSDEGMGIPDNKMKDLFVAFSKSTDGTRNEKGTGLGLWIAKVFTELHEGKIYLESTKGKGTTFTIKLPIA